MPGNLDLLGGACVKRHFPSCSQSFFTDGEANASVQRYSASQASCHPHRPTDHQPADGRADQKLHWSLVSLSLSLSLSPASCSSATQLSAVGRTDGRSDLVVAAHTVESREREKIKRILRDNITRSDATFDPVGNCLQHFLSTKPVKCNLSPACSSVYCAHARNSKAGFHADERSPASKVRPLERT